MTKNESRILMEKIDNGIRAGVNKALEEHKKLGIEIVVWDKKTQSIKHIPPDKIKIAS